MLDQNKLYESLLSWIDNNTSRVSVAQNIANRIKNLNLINSYRKLPFEIVPVDKEANDFKLTIFCCLNQEFIETIKHNIMNEQPSKGNNTNKILIIVLML